MLLFSTANFNASLKQVYSARVITKRKLKLISQMPMFFIFNKESGYSRMLAGGLACIGSGSHVAVIW